LSDLACGGVGLIVDLPVPRSKDRAAESDSGKLYRWREDCSASIVICVVNLIQDSFSLPSSFFEDSI
jgi:hypothetical protein